MRQVVSEPHERYQWTKPSVDDVPISTQVPISAEFLTRVLRLPILPPPSRLLKPLPPDSRSWFFSESLSIRSAVACNTWPPSRKESGKRFVTNRESIIVFRYLYATINDNLRTSSSRDARRVTCERLRQPQRIYKSSRTKPAYFNCDDNE